MNFWTPQHPQMDLAAAIKDCGISDTEDSVKRELWISGWTYDEATGLLRACQESTAPSDRLDGLMVYTPTVMSVFKGSGREIPSAVMSRLPSMMQAGAVEGGN